MEPFTVTCSTCDSRIRVRNPSMVGQLATCPKCGSMIMIAPAAAGAAVTSPRGAVGQVRIEVDGRDGSPVDSMAVTKEGLDGDQFASSPQQSAPADEDDYRLADLPSEGTDNAPHGHAPPVQGQSQHLEAWQPESAAHIPSSQWTSDSTHRTRQYLLVGFLGVSGVVLAAVLFFGFLRWYSNDRPGSSQAALPAQPSLSTDSRAEPADDAASNVPGPDTPDPSTTPPNSNDPTIAPPLAEEKNGDEAEASHIEPAPLNLNPEPAGEALASELGHASEGPVTGTSGDSPVAAPPLPKQLAAFAPMLQYEIQPQFPDAIEILSEAPVTAEDLGLTTAAGLPEIPAIDLSAQLQLKISGLVIAPLPLSQFVSLWSNISGIPTVVDLDSLSAAALDRNQKLSLGLVQSTTLESLIPQLGQNLKLQAEPRDNRYLELVPPQAMIEQQLPSSLALDGLITDASGEEWLKETLKQFFPEQDIEWRTAAGQLERPQLADGSPLDAKAWFSVVRLIEGWRLASGGASSLTQYSSTQLSAEMIQPTDVAGLQVVLNQVTPQSRPVAQVLPRLCQAAGVQAWIDWANVGAVGLGPESTAVFVTSARPLERVLADYASEFSLVVAVLDKQSLWITSNPAYRTAPQLYVIASADRTAEEWKSHLRPLTPAAADGVGVGSVIVIPTPDQQFMLVRCCRPTVGF